MNNTLYSHTALISCVIIFLGLLYFGLSQPIQGLAKIQPTDQVNILSLPFYYTFSRNEIIQMQTLSDRSIDPFLWLTSGSALLINDGTGKTLQGELTSNDKKRLSYLITNPIDTDNGYHPQNVFRIVTRGKNLQNIRQEVSVKINHINASNSPNRNGSNGIHLFNHYIDQYNLYTAGVRVDGQAVIKKKLSGIYYTLSSKKIYSGIYNRKNNPNLLPLGRWFGMRSDIITNEDGTVLIQLYLDRDNTGKWTLITTAFDDAITYGKAISEEGRAGIRTDFMDVEFDDYTITATPLK